MKLFISCAIGLEPVLAEELNEICPQAEMQPTKAGVWLQSDLADAYKCALWSRVASRVILPIFECEANVDALYEAALYQDWSEHMLPGARIAIDFSGKNNHIRHTRFGALKIKDAIADWHKVREYELPELVKEHADIRLSARIHRGKVSVALDFSGHAMHRRGYRQRQGVAPLRENLAAGLLYRAKWPQMAKTGASLLDPMCGSGTLVIEAALMATNAAPGLKRDSWGFDQWPGHDQSLWLQLLQDAEQAFKKGREAFTGRLYGSDSEAHMTHVARDNASRAAVHELIEFATADATELAVPEGVDAAAQDGAPPGLLITNPPYGERLGDEAQVAYLYERFGKNLIEQFQGWQAAILAANAEFGRRLGLHSHKQYQFDNGTLACMLLLFEIKTANRIVKKQAVEPSEGARMVANRIKKNMSRMNAWLAREDIQSYRAYDADIPEYSAAADLYQTEAGRCAVVQEYAPPKTVDAAKARHRLNEIVTAVHMALAVDNDRIYVKSRERQRGTSQYERAQQAGAEPLFVREGKAIIELNLEDYLDTGLFLDHRPIRREIAKMASGKSFLNLFSYTSVATVQAALGGAKRSLSVDMSNTYLDWSERNFRHNHMDLSRHRLMRADCLKFLHSQSLVADEKFDLIFLDPPSFSNSKKMDDVLDIQRDHVKLIQQAMQLLEDKGTLIFSTNLRKFKMDEQSLAAFTLLNYTQESLDPDFQRNQRIHQCWKISND